MGCPARRKQDTVCPVDKCLPSLAQGEVRGGCWTSTKFAMQILQSTEQSLPWQIKSTDVRPRDKDVVMALEIEAAFGI